MIVLTAIHLAALSGLVTGIGLGILLAYWVWRTA